MTANCVLAAFHSRDAIFQFWLTSRKTKNSSLDAASSLGKWPRTRTALRKRLCRLSMAFVTGMRIAVPTHPAGNGSLPAYGATIRDEGHREHAEWAGRSIG